EYILTGLFCTGLFVFFAFFYNHHLHFAEQIQLFLLTGDYFITKMSMPGGFSGYLGEFLTQFYYLPLAGPLILTLLLLSVQLITKRLLLSIDQNRIFFPLSFLPALYAGMIMCNEFYPLSAVTGYLVALLAGWFYTSIKSERSRFTAGFILIPLTWWLAGGSYLMLLTVVLVYEFILYIRLRREGRNEKITGTKPETAGGLRTWYFLLYLIPALALPLFVRQYIVHQPVMTAFMSEYYYNVLIIIPKAIPVLFSIPAILMMIVYMVPVKEKYLKPLLVTQSAGLIIFTWVGFMIWANFGAEVIMTYDYLVRTGKWNEVLKLAEEKPPRNYLSLAMLNLSLAKTGQMGDRMFSYDQRGVNGLFLPFNREYVAPMMGNEIFYNLALTNASQEYAFESMETIPNHNKSSRVIKRLAETNLINGNYAVSGKYLTILDKTLFYRKWSSDTRKYLHNEDMINMHPDWGEKRKFMVRNDYFFHVQNMEAALNRMVKENPGNRLAFEYLMAFYMINKDLRNFMNCIPLLEKMNYREIPVSYQEAMLYIIGLSTRDPFSQAPSYISSGVRNRMREYAEIYTKYDDAEERLWNDHSGTYWYYLHFARIEKPEPEK
ncbi:MAG: DUF6057 family protein, partial [Bacteroidales bacterium]